MATLNIIGCGRAGRVLGGLWQKSSAFSIGGIVNRTMDSARRAAKQIGAGDGVANMDDLPEAEYWLIATPDQAIGPVSAALAKSRFNQPDIKVFHLSGSLESALLKHAGLVGQVACVHPLRSFADYDSSVRDFDGTWCGFEGDPELRHQLVAAFVHIGGKVFDIPAGNKLLYHAGSVMISNYLNAVVECGLRLYRSAGIDDQIARQLIAPITTGTVSNINAQGTIDSLTGPIMRGDWQVIEAELVVLDSENPELAAVYRQLGMITLSMIESRLALDQVSRLKDILQ